MADEKGGFFSSDHQTNETVWDLVGGIPVLGNVINGANVVGDLYNIATTDDKEVRAQNTRDLAKDGLGFLPFIGTAVGMGSVMYDVASNDTASDVIDGMLGGQKRDPNFVDPEAGYNANPRGPNQSVDPSTQVSVQPPQVSPADDGN